jgi:putative membrane protein
MTRRGAAVPWLARRFPHRRHSKVVAFSVLLSVFLPTVFLGGSAASAYAPDPAVRGTAADIDPVRGDLDTSDWDTPTGPLSQYDRNLLIHVKWANLWEGPTSERLAERSANPRVRAVAAQLSREHHALDTAVAEAAGKVGVPLPDTANPLQQAWLTGILAQSGTAADDSWANITRQAHGTIFMLIAQVRSTTRNDVIREFAQAAVTTVLRHMTLLESTTLVRSDALYIGSGDMAPHQPMPNRDELILGVAAALIVLILTVVLVRAGARYEPRSTPA